MGLREIAANKLTPLGIDELKAQVTAAVQAHLDLQSTGDVVEVVVPRANSQELASWVESEGLRCSCTCFSGGHARLTINLSLAPPAPRSDAEIQREIAAAVEATRAQNEYRAREEFSPRLEALEAVIASISAQLESGKLSDGGE